MLRTNSKKARENIRKYIMNNFDGEVYGYPENVSFKEAKEIIKKAFYDEKVKYDNRKITIPELFADWCSGLPSILDTCYYYNRSAVADVAEILESGDAGKKYGEREAENLLTKLIYKELFA